MSVIVTTILSEGKEMDPAYGLISLEVTKELNRVPTAQLQLQDGDVARAERPISDSSFFEPGKEIEIKLGFVGIGDETVFKGIVVRHGIESTLQGSRLTIDLKDRASKLTNGRKSAVFRDQTDSDAIQKILNDAGVPAGEIAATRPSHPELVQYRCSDWDFLLSRADVLGLVVAVDDGEVSVKEMKPGGGARRRFKFGVDEIHELTMEIDGTGQPQSVESVGWDLEKLEPTSTSKADPVATPLGNVDGGDLARKVGGATLALAHLVPMSDQELKAWADAAMAKARLSMVRGRLTIPGTASIKLLDVVELASVGQRFDGEAMVTLVHHTVEEGQWKTEVRLGLDPDWFHHRAHIAETPAAGLLPPVNGLQIGVVEEHEDDPDDEYRVKVKLPAIDEVVWARLATPEAGKDRGYFFRPEPGDEVVLGFFNGDPRQPVILGAMFGSRNEPHDLVKNLSDKNVHKAIITKKGTMIAFVDEDKASLVIETKDHNRILLDDDEKLIELEDQHGNRITMNEDGITLRSAKDLKIEARGKIDVSAAGDTTVTSDASMTLQAPKVDIQ